MRASTWPILTLWILPTVALAHPGHTDLHVGFVHGFLHPLSGPDHVIAMLAVGIWGLQLGGAALWLLPVAFPVAMVMAGMLGASGVQLPGIELGIALSAVGLGMAIALQARPRLAVAAALVAAFALFHGYAHGSELPAAIHPAAYALGFVVSTVALHLTGIVLCMAARSTAGVRGIQAVGASIAAVGLILPMATGVSLV